mmetsp:Transcript_1235/g.4344  ORF Transcript_1235/g.4344 Transcript_1235/m.4344 type:complete len:171 (+) Transcript_1235:440-952(+)
MHYIDHFSRGLGPYRGHDLQWADVDDIEIFAPPRGPLEGALLATVNSAEELGVLCHGTFQEVWPTIQLEGLKTMGRNHIHCVAVDLTAEEHRGRVMNGSRGECDVVVFINAAGAMAEGITFNWSENGVVLTRGFGNVLPPGLFASVARWDWDNNVWNIQDLNKTTGGDGE